MSDFEQRLSAVLVAEVERAPAPVGTGLAEAARRRHVVRRRRRITGGAVAVVLAIGAPVVAVGLGGDADDRTASDPTPVAGWQTIEHHGVLVEVPEDWGVADCRDEPVSEIVQYSPDGGSCEDGTGFLTIYPAEEEEDEGVVERFEWEAGRSFFGGYVEAGDWGIGMWGADRDLVLRVLASFRLAGQPQVVADAWQETIVDGITYRAPVGWGVGGDESDGYQVEVDPAVSREKRLASSEEVDEAHYLLVGQLPDRVVTVTAPTKAVAQLVWATVEPAESSGSTDPAAGLPCDPGMGDPQSRDSCPYAYSTGLLSLDAVGDVALDPVGGSPYAVDLDAVPQCSGVVQVDYREPLADHAVECAEFRTALEAGTPPIPVVLWTDDSGDVVQLSELYRP